MTTFLLVYFVLGLLVGVFYVGVGWPPEASWNYVKWLLGVFFLWPMWVAVAVIFWLSSR